MRVRTRAVAGKIETDNGMRKERDRETDRRESKEVRASVPTMRHQTNARKHVRNRETK